ncbi:LysR family transcriptional regulator [Paraburkholderia sediminicola]|uniref:LysR family transcriptional regulator n=1 Tax=Paraburkholderia metrosideri TaxID=580937 RepID=A0ABW9DU77_9BURK
MLNSHLLRCFLAVLEHRTLTAAALHLCTTQPALSKSLRRLEDELGVPLFERKPGGMIPTAYGLALAHRARLIDQESDKARAELRTLREGGAGWLTIGIGPLWAVHILPDVLADLRLQHSGLRVRVVSGVLDTLRPELLKGEVDVVCAALDFPDQPGLIKEYLLDSEHVIIAHNTHPLAAAPLVTSAELSNCAFAGLHNDYAVLERMDRFFSLRGLRSPGFAVEAGSLEMLLSLVATGAFVATQSNQVLSRASRLGIQKLPTDGSIWSFRGGVVYREATVNSPLLQLFLQALRARFVQ